MSSIRINFQNQQNITLAANLELPVDRNPIAYCVFAHCFTCSKDFTATANISRALTSSGIAVLRFDFTGLGRSKGEFADSNFTTNIEDLVSAAQFLTENYKAPQIIVGHSLGGTAVLQVASQLPSVKAVVTIGSPAEATHVQHMLTDSLEEINKSGVANVNLGGRPFTIKKQFVDDLSKSNLEDQVANIRKALLFMHSPQDKIVGIENASKLYMAAHHPKSFVSLDGADHLLMKKEDSWYVGNVIAQWAVRYITNEAEELLITDMQAVVSTGEQGYTTLIRVGDHNLIADEPESAGGNNLGPTPYDLLVSALGACTSITLRMYADRKKWSLEEVRVHLDHSKTYAQDSTNVNNQSSKIDLIERQVELIGNLDQEQRQRLLEIADKCPVHKTLHNQIEVRTSLKTE